MTDFLGAAWHLRYVLAVTAVLAWLGIRLPNNAIDDYIDRHVTAAIGPVDDRDTNGDTR